MQEGSWSRSFPLSPLGLVGRNFPGPSQGTGGSWTHGGPRWLPLIPAAAPDPSSPAPRSTRLVRGAMGEEAAAAAAAGTQRAPSPRGGRQRVLQEGQTPGCPPPRRVPVPAGCASPCRGGQALPGRRVPVCAVCVQTTSPQPPTLHGCCCCCRCPGFAFSFPAPGLGMAAPGQAGATLPRARCGSSPSLSLLRVLVYGYAGDFFLCMKP